MTLATQLLGCRRQQQHARRALGQLGHQAIFGAGNGFRPIQMVCLVDHEQVPLTLDERPSCGGRPDDPIQAAEHLLIGEKGVGLGDGLEALVIEERDTQVEASPHLDQPLVEQRLGRDHQHPLRSARQQHPMQDQSGLDGLAEPDLVGQEHARGIASGHLGRNLELMRDQPDPCADQAPRRRARLAHPQEPGPPAQIEPMIRVEPPGHETLMRPVEPEPVVQLGFVKRDDGAVRLFTAIGEKARVARDREDQKIPTLSVAHMLARRQLQTHQRRVRQGIDALLAGRPIGDLDTTPVDGGHEAEAEFPLGLAQPALAGDEAVHTR